MSNTEKVWDRIRDYVQQAWDDEVENTWGSFKNKVADLVLADKDLFVADENQEIPENPITNRLTDERYIDGILHAKYKEAQQDMFKAGFIKKE